MPARSVTMAVKLQVPLAIVLMSQKLMVDEAVNEQDALSVLLLKPLIVAMSPTLTPVIEMRGVASRDVVAPLSCALKGAVVAAGTTVSIVAIIGGVGVEALFARSVMTAVMLHAPSARTGIVQVRSVEVAVKAHRMFCPFRVAVTTTRSVGLASAIVTVGVESLVIPSVALLPVSELATTTAGFVADGAVVSMVMVNCSEAATIRLAISCRARYVHVPSARVDVVHDSVVVWGTKLQTTFVKPGLTNVTFVSTDGTKSPNATVGVESDSGELLMTTGILAVISRTVTSPLDIAVEFAE